MVHTMEKKDYKIIVLDLDGTLTNSQKVITPKTKDALMKIQKAGKKVVLASGRPTPGIVKLADELELAKYEGYILSFNGGHIIDYATKEAIYDRTVPMDIIPELYAKAKELNLGILTYDKEEIIIGNGIDEYSQLEAKINGIPMREVDNFVTYVNYPVNKFLYTGAPDKILEAQKIMRDNFGWELNIFRSEPFFLELMPQSIDKAFSLEKLLEHLGIDRAQMICCGDGFNDKSMIRFAGLGVAMSNAQKEVKEVADYITQSNDEDGIAQVIEKFIL